jgi:hypothetical protein
MALLLILLTGVTGCVSEGGPPDPAPWAAQGNHMGCAQNMPPPTVPGTMAWNGAALPMAAPYTADPPRNPLAAQAQMWNSVPLDMVQQANFAPPSPLNNSGIQVAGGPGAAPGSSGNGPPWPQMPAGGGCFPPAAVAGVGMNLPGSSSPFRSGRTSVRFSGPSGMKVSWYSPGPDGKNANTAAPINVPGRYNFLQGAFYRLKLTDIAGRQGLELYPSLEVVPTNSRTNEFLSHAAVPLIFTDDDFDQVTSGNYVIKVIYLPDPRNQDLANPGVAGEVVSTKLEPGVDPIAQAQSLGSILLVIRMGNIDLEAPNTPAMDAPNPFAPRQPVAPMPQPSMGPGPAGPFGGMPPSMMAGGFPGMGGPMMGGPMMGGPMMGGAMGGPPGPMMNPGAMPPGAMPPSGPYGTPTGAPVPPVNATPSLPPNSGASRAPAPTSTLPPLPVSGPMLPPVPTTSNSAAGQGSGPGTQPVLFQVPPAGGAAPANTGIGGLFAPSSSK